MEDSTEAAMNQNLTGPTQDLGSEYATRDPDAKFVLEIPTVRQQVFGKLMWRPDRARELHQW
jgi:hypothetical protein